VGAAPFGFKGAVFLLVLCFLSQGELFENPATVVTEVGGRTFRSDLRAAHFAGL